MAGKQGAGGKCMHLSIHPLYRSELWSAFTSIQSSPLLSPAHSIFTPAKLGSIQASAKAQGAVQK